MRSRRVNGLPRRILCLLAAGPGMAVGAAGASAQQVFTGRVVEEGTLRPVAAAFVTVDDTEGDRVVAGLTDADGRFYLEARVPDGRYVLGAERLGYGSVEAEPEQVADGEPLETTLVLPTQAIAVEAIEVSGVRRCELDREEGLRISALWEEARKALEIAAWTEEEELFRFWGRRYERLYPVATGRIERESSRTLDPGSRPPFFGRPIQELVDEGYVRSAPGRAFDYFAPDAAGVLSPEFQDAYCFRLVERSPSGLVGLSFEPVEAREITDITGVLWLDEESERLRHLEFEYTRHPVRLGIPPWLLPVFGGRIDFRELPNGAWVIDRWTLRMPEYQGRQLAVFQDWGPVREAVEEMIGARSLRTDLGVPPEDRIPARDRDVVPLLGVKEEGGELAAVEDEEGVELVTPEFAVLEGTVYDSTRATPFSGARIRLSGTEHRVLADRTGRFRLVAPTEGRFELTVRHSRLDSLDVGTLTGAVELERGRVERIELAGPSWTSLYAMACEPEEGRGVVGGRVVDAALRAPVEGGRVELLGDSLQGPLHAGEADGEGMFVLCSVPAGSYRVAATVYGVTEVVDSIRLGAGEVRSLDIEAPDAREGVVRGLVRGGEDRAPLPGATVRIEGRTLRTVRTDEEGSFEVAELPVGPYTVQVDHMAHRGVSREVTVEGGGRAVNLEVRLLRDAIALDPITVEVESGRPTFGPLVDVYDRMDRLRRLGTGQFLDQRDIDGAVAGSVSQLLARMTGVRPQPIPGKAGLSLVLNQRGCSPSYYVDGLLVNSADEGADPFTIDERLPLSELAAVEVYRRSTELPGEFADPNAQSCGAIVLWSRRGR